MTKQILPDTDDQQTESGCPMAKIDRVSNNILKYIRKKLLAKYGNEKPLRAFHAKSIGLVEARVEIKPGLDEQLCKGLFKEHRIYKAWVRYSNGSGSVSADFKKGVRGMAIKLLDVQGSGFLDPDPEGRTQDIILFTSPIHIPSPVNKQVLVPRLVLGNIFTRFFAFLCALPIRLSRIIRFLRGNIRTPNILGVNYYSASPWLYGERAVKWHVRPVSIISTEMPAKPSADHLRRQLKQDLSDHTADKIELGLFIQFSENENSEPIEDTSVEWKTPFYQVASIRFPIQDFDTPERKTKDLNMSFSPGHAVLEHQPLGNINRVRRKVYQQLGKERREHQ